MYQAVTEKQHKKPGLAHSLTPAQSLILTTPRRTHPLQNHPHAFLRCLLLSHEGIRHARQGAPLCMLVYVIVIIPHMEDMHHQNLKINIIRIPNQERATPNIPPIQPATIERMTLFKPVTVIIARGASFAPIIMATIAKMTPTKPP